MQCTGGCHYYYETVQYVGIHDCALPPACPAAAYSSFSFGCLGFSTLWASNVSFDAIHVVDGVAKVDEEKLRPQEVRGPVPAIILLAPLQDQAPRGYCITCSSGDKGADVRKVCDKRLYRLWSVRQGSAQRKPSPGIRIWLSLTMMTSAWAAACAPRSVPASSSLWTERSRGGSRLPLGSPAAAKPGGSGVKSAISSGLALDDCPGWSYFICLF